MNTSTMCVYSFYIIYSQLCHLKIQCAKINMKMFVKKVLCISIIECLNQLAEIDQKQTFLFEFCDINCNFFTKKLPHHWISICRAVFQKSEDPSSKFFVIFLNKHDLKKLEDVLEQLKRSSANRVSEK